MARDKVANRRLTSIIINGVVAYDLGSDYGFTLTPAENQAALTVGITSAMTKFNSDTTAMLDIQLLTKSTTNDYLFELIYNQSRGNGVLFDITLISDINETFYCHNCAITTPSPVVAGDPDNTPRTWRFTVEEWREEF